MRVIFHIDELNKWSLTLGNVTNMINYYQENKIEYQIEVLANSEAVLAYQHEHVLKKQMEQLSLQQVSFVACNNALNANNLKQDSLHDFVSIVPAGVVELAQKQLMGFSYIKP